MIRERVSEDIYVFTSEMYAQVTAGAIIAPEGAILIDTLAFPVETREIKDFLENRLGLPVRYVIVTHYHADHTNGVCLFPQAFVIGHQLCRQKLDTVGRQGLEQARQQQPAEVAGIEIVLPQGVLTEGPLYLHWGKKTLQLFPTPGHTADSLAVLLKDERILFAGDMMMPLPHIVDGDLEAAMRSLQAIPSLGLENIIQGHGEVILRGELDEAVRSNLKYLDLLRRKVETVVKKRKPRSALSEITLESCGKNRIPLNGLVVQLHAANVVALYNRLVSEK